MDCGEVPRVYWSALRGGVEGIALGCEEYFLDVRSDGEGRLRVQLLNLMEPDRVKPVTAWIRLRQPEDLRVSRHADLFRKILKRAFREHGDEVLERIILLLQEHAEDSNGLNEAVGEESSPLDGEVEGRIDEEVKRILEAQNMLEALKPHLDRVIVGEDENKQAILVLLSGSKYPEVEKKQIILLKGTEGGGKTTLASTLTGFYKTKRVGRFSEHALEYSNLEGCEVLYIQELGSMDLDKQGVAAIKFLSADDRGFTVEYTVRDAETGRFRTEQKRIPAMTTVSTTTRLMLDSQFERRAWLFNVDESSGQTERVKRWKAWLGRQRDEVKVGMRKITDYEFSREVLRRFIAQLKPCKIIIPFRETVADILKSESLRVRGDIDKVYTFIELYGLFNLRRLQKIRDEVYAVTPDVALEAIKIAEKPLISMLGSGDERVKPLLQALRDLGLKAFDVIDKGIREQMAVKLGKSEETVRLYLNLLEKRGVLSSDNKKPKTYTLLYPLQDVEQKLCEKSLILKVSDDLHDKMVEEARKWLDSLSLKPTPEDTYASCGGEKRHELGFEGEGKEGFENREKEESRLEDSQNMHISTEAGFNNSDRGVFQPSLDERSGENPNFPKFRMFRVDSEGWNLGGWFKWKRVKPSEPCELCGKHPTEYLIHIMEWGTTLHRCESCFNDFRRTFGGT